MKATQEEYALKVRSRNPNVELVGKYKGSKKSIKAKCACGRVWEIRADRLLQKGARCPECAKKRKSQGNVSKMTKELFEERLRDVAPDIKLVGPYTNTKIPTDFMCKNGHTFKARPGHVLYDGLRCEACNLLERTKNHDDFVAEVNSVLPGYKIIGEYRGRDKPIEVECPNGHHSFMRPKNMLHGWGCKYCASEKQKITNHEFLHKLMQKTTTITPLEAYNSYNSPIKVRCEKCGTEFHSTPNRLLHATGSGCATCAAEEFVKASSKECCDGKGNRYNSITEMCNAYEISTDLLKSRLSRGLALQEALECPKNMSTGEYRIAEVLKKKNIDFIRDKTISAMYSTLDDYYQNVMLKYNELLDNKGYIDLSSIANFRYDFTATRGSQILFLIEFDGEQHFKKDGHFIKTDEEFVKRHVADLAKGNFAKRAKIPLLRIRYDQVNLIEELVNDIIDHPEWYIEGENKFLSKREYWAPYEKNIKQFIIETTYSVD